MIAIPDRTLHLQTEELPSQRIRRETEMNVAYFAAHPDEIEMRLRELDEEWDLERALDAVSSTLSLTGLLMGLMGRRAWLLLPLTVQGFFLQHAVQGWCPPIPALRRMGFRTRAEIEAERYALKAIHGDFRELDRAENLDAQQCAALAIRAIGNGSRSPGQNMSAQAGGEPSADREPMDLPNEPGSESSDEPDITPGDRC